MRRLLLFMTEMSSISLDPTCVILRQCRFDTLDSHTFSGDKRAST